MDKADIDEARAIFEDMLKGYECKRKDCPFKGLERFMLRIERFLEQYKCVEKFKYEESERQGGDIGEERALMLWYKKGYAKIFRSVYQRRMRLEDIYDKVMHYDNQVKSLDNKVAPSDNQVKVSSQDTSVNSVRTLDQINL